MKIFQVLKNCCMLAVMLVSFATEAWAEMPLPSIEAPAAILVEATTGRVLFEKNADEVRYPASMTKMMTCILALEKGRPDDGIIISNVTMEAPYSYLSFSTGEMLPLQEILEGMMLCSDNAAATAVAENLGRTYQDFIDEMNLKAKNIGAFNTHFCNPHGLTEDDHYSTARDMMTIARYGWSKPQFREIVGKKYELIEWSKPGERSKIAENTNELLEVYPGMVGIKTGWTSDAGGCLASAAERNGITLIAVVMGTDYESERFSDTSQLLDYGFNLIRGEKGPVKERLGKEIKVKGSRKRTIVAYPAFDIVWPLADGESAEQFSLRWEMPESVPAPVKKDQKVGDLLICRNGQEIGRTPILASEDADTGFSLMAKANDICDSLYMILFC